MGKKRIISLFLAAACVLSLLSGCGPAGSDTTDGANGKHEPITMLSTFDGMEKFVELLNEKYPEIDLEIIPYSGANMTAYVRDELTADDMPDIYTTTIYSPGQKDLSDRLIDLSGYDFTNAYAEARLRDVSDNGAIYLLPAYYSCLGITYNKTLLKEHGWTLPTTFAELEALAPKVKEAGCTLAVDQLALPGYGFQYFCNILDTDFLNTLDGRKWQNDFLAGKATVKDTPGMMNAMSTLEKWKEIGMLSGNSFESPSDARLEMAKGNTLFMLGASNSFTEEESKDEFGMMPYLSADGTQNSLILNVSRYVGLNKKLEDKGNEQKLADAVHVMEVLSTVEGLSALTAGYEDSTLLPLQDYEIPESSYYKEIEDDLNAGMTAPFIYAGWDNLIVTTGEAVLSYIQGTATIEDVVKAFDGNQHLLFDDNAGAVTTAAEELDTDACARLVGIAFGKAANADLSLISKNKWYPVDGGYTDLDQDGVSGSIFPMAVHDQEITAILPTGWRGNIKTVTLTGKRIQELAESGYDKDGMLFPYELVTPESLTIDDDTTYTAVICGVNDAVAEEGTLTDTGIRGLDAATDYLSQFKTLSKSDLIWE